MDNPSACYNLPQRTRVVCPECGSGGANSGPCYCHVCEDPVMMLPEHGNWGEFVRRIVPQEPM